MNSGKTHWRVAKLLSYAWLLAFGSTADKNEPADGIQTKHYKHPRFGYSSIRYCAFNQYYDEHEGSCVVIPGGGSALSIDDTETCNTETLRPHPSCPNYYYAYRGTKTIFAKCPDDQQFENQLKRCAITNMKQCHEEKALEDPNKLYNHVRLPPCKEPGRFPICSDKSIYYTCTSNGFRLYREIHCCPSSHSFDPDIDTCVPDYVFNHDSISKNEPLMGASVLEPTKLDINQLTMARPVIMTTIGETYDDQVISIVPTKEVSNQQLWTDDESTSIVRNDEVTKSTTIAWGIRSGKFIVPNVVVTLAERTESSTSSSSTLESRGPEDAEVISSRNDPTDSSTLTNERYSLASPLEDESTVSSPLTSGANEQGYTSTTMADDVKSSTNGPWDFSSLTIAQYVSMGPLEDETNVSSSSTSVTNEKEGESTTPEDAESSTNGPWDFPTLTTAQYVSMGPLEDETNVSSSSTSVTNEKEGEATTPEDVESSTNGPWEPSPLRTIRYSSTSPLEDELTVSSPLTSGMTEKEEELMITEGVQSSTPGPWDSLTSTTAKYYPKTTLEDGSTVSSPLTSVMTEKEDESTTTDKVQSSSNGPREPSSLGTTRYSSTSPHATRVASIGDDQIGKIIREDSEPHGGPSTNVAFSTKNSESTVSSPLTSGGNEQGYASTTMTGDVKSSTNGPWDFSTLTTAQYVSMGPLEDETNVSSSSTSFTNEKEGESTTSEDVDSSTNGPWEPSPLRTIRYSSTSPLEDELTVSSPLTSGMTEKEEELMITEGVQSSTPGPWDSSTSTTAIYYPKTTLEDGSTVSSPLTSGMTEKEDESTTTNKVQSSSNGPQEPSSLGTTRYSSTSPHATRVASIGDDQIGKIILEDSEPHGGPSTNVAFSTKNSESTVISPLTSGVNEQGYASTTMTDDVKSSTNGPWDFSSLTTAQNVSMGPLEDETNVSSSSTSVTNEKEGEATTPEDVESSTNGPWEPSPLRTIRYSSTSPLEDELTVSSPLTSGMTEKEEELMITEGVQSSTPGPWDSLTSTTAKYYPKTTLEDGSTVSSPLTSVMTEKEDESTTTDKVQSSSNGPREPSSLGTTRYSSTSPHATRVASIGDDQIGKIIREDSEPHGGPSTNVAFSTKNSESTVSSPLTSGGNEQGYASTTMTDDVKSSTNGPWDFSTLTTAQYVSMGPLEDETNVSSSSTSVTNEKEGEATTPEDVESSTNGPWEPSPLRTIRYSSTSPLEDELTVSSPLTSGMTEKEEELMITEGVQSSTPGPWDSLTSTTAKYYPKTTLEDGSTVSSPLTSVMTEKEDESTTTDKVQSSSNGPREPSSLGTTRYSSTSPHATRVASIGDDQIGKIIREDSEPHGGPSTNVAFSTKNSESTVSSPLTSGGNEQGYASTTMTGDVKSSTNGPWDFSTLTTAQYVSMGPLEDETNVSSSSTSFTNEKEGESTTSEDVDSSTNGPWEPSPLRTIRYSSTSPLEDELTVSSPLTSGMTEKEEELMITEGVQSSTPGPWDSSTSTTAIYYPKTTLEDGSTVSSPLTSGMTEKEDESTTTNKVQSSSNGPQEPSSLGTTRYSSTSPHATRVASIGDDQIGKIIREDSEPHGGPSTNVAFSTKNSESTVISPLTSGVNEQGYASTTMTDDVKSSTNGPWDFSSLTTAQNVSMGPLEDETNVSSSSTSVTNEKEGESTTPEDAESSTNGPWDFPTLTTAQYVSMGPLEDETNVSSSSTSVTNEKEGEATTPEDVESSTNGPWEPSPLRTIRYSSTSPLEDELTVSSPLTSGMTEKEEELMITEGVQSSTPGPWDSLTSTTAKYYPKTTLEDGSTVSSPLTSVMTEKEDESTTTDKVQSSSNGPREPSSLGTTRYSSTSPHATRVASIGDDQIGKIIREDSEPHGGPSTNVAFSTKNSESTVSSPLTSGVNEQGYASTTMTGDVKSSTNGPWDFSTLTTAQYVSMGPLEDETNVSSSSTSFTNEKEGESTTSEDVESSTNGPWEPSPLRTIRYSSTSPVEDELTVSSPLTSGMTEKEEELMITEGVQSSTPGPWDSLTSTTAIYYPKTTLEDGSTVSSPLTSDMTEKEDESTTTNKVQSSSNGPREPSSLGTTRYSSTSPHATRVASIGDDQIGKIIREDSEPHGGPSTNVAFSTKNSESTVISPLTSGVNEQGYASTTMTGDVKSSTNGPWDFSSLTTAQNVSMGPLEDETNVSSSSTSVTNEKEGESTTPEDAESSTNGPWEPSPLRTIRYSSISPLEDESTVSSPLTSGMIENEDESTITEEVQSSKQSSWDSSSSTFAGYSPTTPLEDDSTVSSPLTSGVTEQGYASTTMTDDVKSSTNGPWDFSLLTTARYVSMGPLEDETNVSSSSTSVTNEKEGESTTLEDVESSTNGPWESSSSRTTRYSSISPLEDESTVSSPLTSGMTENEDESTITEEVKSSTQGSWDSSSSTFAGYSPTTPLEDDSTVSSPLTSGVTEQGYASTTMTDDVKSSTNGPWDFSLLTTARYVSMGPLEDETNVSSSSTSVTNEKEGESTTLEDVESSTNGPWESSSSRTTRYSSISPLEDESTVSSPLTSGMTENEDESTITEEVKSSTQGSWDSSSSTFAGYSPTTPLEDDSTVSSPLTSGVTEQGYASTTMTDDVKSSTNGPWDFSLLTTARYVSMGPLEDETNVSSSSTSVTNEKEGESTTLEDVESSTNGPWESSSSRTTRYSSISPLEDESTVSSPLTSGMTENEDESTITEEVKSSTQGSWDSSSSTFAGYSPTTPLEDGSSVSSPLTSGMTEKEDVPTTTEKVRSSTNGPWEPSPLRTIRYSSTSPLEDELTVSSPLTSGMTEKEEELMLTEGVQSSTPGPWDSLTSTTAIYYPKTTREDGSTVSSPLTSGMTENEDESTTTNKVQSSSNGPREPSLLGTTRYSSTSPHATRVASIGDDQIGKIIREDSEPHGGPSTNVAFSTKNSESTVISPLTSGVNEQGYASTTMTDDVKSSTNGPWDFSSLTTAQNVSMGPLEDETNVSSSSTSVTNEKEGESTTPEDAESSTNGPWEPSPLRTIRYSSTSPLEDETNVSSQLTSGMTEKEDVPTTTEKVRSSTNGPWEPSSLRTTRYFSTSPLEDESTVSSPLTSGMTEKEDESTITEVVQSSTPGSWDSSSSTFAGYSPTTPLEDGSSVSSPLTSGMTEKEDVPTTTEKVRSSTNGPWESSSLRTTRYFSTSPLEDESTVSSPLTSGMTEKEDESTITEVVQSSTQGSWDSSSSTFAGYSPTTPLEDGSSVSSPLTSGMSEKEDVSTTTEEVQSSTNGSWEPPSSLTTTRYFSTSPLEDELTVRSPLTSGMTEKEDELMITEGVQSSTPGPWDSLTSTTAIYYPKTTLEDGSTVSSPLTSGMTEKEDESTTTDKVQSSSNGPWEPSSLGTTRYSSTSPHATRVASIGDDQIGKMIREDSEPHGGPSTNVAFSTKNSESTVSSPLTSGVTEQGYASTTMTDDVKSSTNGPRDFSLLTTAQYVSMGPLEDETNVSSSSTSVTNEKEGESTTLEDVESSWESSSSRTTRYSSISPLEDESTVSSPLTSGMTENEDESTITEEVKRSTQGSWDSSSSTFAGYSSTTPLEDGSSVSSPLTSGMSEKEDVPTTTEKVRSSTNGPWESSSLRTTRYFSTSPLEDESTVSSPLTSGMTEKEDESTITEVVQSSTQGSWDSSSSTFAGYSPTTPLEDGSSVSSPLTSGMSEKEDVSTTTEEVQSSTNGSWEPPSSLTTTRYFSTSPLEDELTVRSPLTSGMTEKEDELMITEGVQSSTPGPWDSLTSTTAIYYPKTTLEDGSTVSSPLTSGMTEKEDESTTTDKVQSSSNGPWEPSSLGTTRYSSTSPHATRVASIGDDQIGKMIREDSEPHGGPSTNVAFSTKNSESTVSSPLTSGVTEQGYASTTMTDDVKSSTNGPRDFSLLTTAQYVSMGPLEDETNVSSSSTSVTNEKEGESTTLEDVESSTNGPWESSSSRTTRYSSISPLEDESTVSSPLTSGMIENEDESMITEEVQSSKQSSWDSSSSTFAGYSPTTPLEDDSTVSSPLTSGVTEQGYASTTMTDDVKSSTNGPWDFSLLTTARYISMGPLEDETNVSSSSTSVTNEKEGESTTLEDVESSTNGPWESSSSRTTRYSSISPLEDESTVSSPLTSGMTENEDESTITEEVKSSTQGSWDSSSSTFAGYSPTTPLEDGSSVSSPLTSGMSEKEDVSTTTEEVQSSTNGSWEPFSLTTTRYSSTSPLEDESTVSSPLTSGMTEKEDESTITEVVQSSTQGSWDSSSSTFAGYSPTTPLQDDSTVSSLLTSGMTETWGDRWTNLYRESGYIRPNRANDTNGVETSPVFSITTETATLS